MGVIDWAAWAAWLAAPTLAAVLGAPWVGTLTGDHVPTWVCDRTINGLPVGPVHGGCRLIAPTSSRCGTAAVSIAWAARRRSSTSSVIAGTWTVSAGAPLAAVSVTTAAGVTATWTPALPGDTVARGALSGPWAGTHRVAASTVPVAGTPCAAEARIVVTP